MNAKAADFGINWQGNGDLTVNIPSRWQEHVYSGIARVSLYRGDPFGDRITRIEIVWQDKNLEQT